MYIGSGDTTALLSGLNTGIHKSLLRRFVSGEVPNYNAKSSPIDALRTGAILEERFFMYLGDKYLSQYKVYDSENDCCKSTLDFASIENDKVVDFIELKTAWLTDFQNINLYRDKSKDEQLAFLAKEYKHNYEQVQFQLMCTGLLKAHLCYLEVQSYKDTENYSRDIKPDEYVIFEIDRDENVIQLIKTQVMPFQFLRDTYVTY